MSASVSHSTSLDAIRRWPGPRAEAWVRGFLEDARKDPRIVAVVAVGSAVQGAGHASSDLDLAVLFEGEKPRLAPPLEVDIRTYPFAQVESLIASGHELLGWAVRYGVAVHDPSRRWSTIAAAWRERLPLPSAAVAEERARRSVAAARELMDVGDETAALELLLAAVTQRARARLLRLGIYPASRPELPGQLRAVGEGELAGILDALLGQRASARDLLGWAESAA